MTQNLTPIQRYIYSSMGWKRATYVKHRSEGFEGLFPGNMALVEASVLAGMLIKYEEDFLLCSKIEEAMGSIPKVDLPTDNFVQEFAECCMWEILDDTHYQDSVFDRLKD